MANANENDYRGPSHCHGTCAGPAVHRMCRTKMNVLITSAGRRTSLLRAFQEAAHRRGGKVLAGDVDGLAPALYLADIAIRLPRVTDEAYVPTLLELVNRHSIRLVVPTIDTELPVLAAAAHEFAAQGCVVMTSAPQLVRVSGDKWATVQDFGARGIRVPRSWLPDQIDSQSLPDHLFVKPRDGSASQHAQAVSRSQLPYVLSRVPNPIIQEEIGAPELTVDALLDLHGRLIHYVPRLRLRTMAGESIQGVTVPDTDIRVWLTQVFEHIGDLGGRGPITLQAFLTPDGPTLLEINPRFGGGFPLTYAAGGLYPEWILQMLEGHVVAPRLGEYKVNLHMTRYYVEIFTESPLWL